MINLKIITDFTNDSKILLTFTEIPYDKLNPIARSKIIQYFLNIESFYDTPLKEMIYDSITTENDNNRLQIIIPMDVGYMQNFYFSPDYKNALSTYVSDIEGIYKKYNIITEADLVDYSEKDTIIELQENLDSLRKEFEEFKERFDPKNSIDPDMCVSPPHPQYWEKSDNNE